MERLAGSAASMDFMPNGGVEQNTTGESITSDSPSPLRRDEKVHSRFLCPHMASCHDFCKYGKKHDSEVEAMRLNFRNFLKKKKSARNVGQSEVTILVAWERRIETRTKVKSASNVESEFHDDTDVSKTRTSPSTKNSIASGGKKTPQASIGNEQGTKPMAKSNIIAGFPNDTEVRKAHTHPPLKNRTASGAKKTLPTALENEQGRAKSPNPVDGKNAKGNSGGACVTPIQFKPSPASDMEATEQPNIIEQKTKSSVVKSILPVAPKVIQRKASPSVSEAQTLKPKVPRLPKRVDGSGNHAITLKTKTPLRRSLSQHKSSKSLVARSNEENKSMRSPETSRNGGSDLAEQSTVSSFSKSSRTRIDQGNMNKMAKSIATSKIGERKQLKPTPSFFSSKTHDNASSFQLRKLGSIKRTSTPHGNVWGSQLRKLRSIKRNPASQNNVSRLQPRKPRRAKQTLKPRDNVSSLQPRKLRSIKRTSTPLEMVSSLQTRKLRNTKQTSTFHDIVLRVQPRKLRSMKRSSSLKDNEEVDNANAESSEHSIHGVTDKEIKGNDKVDISEHHEKEKSRGSRHVHTSIPFKMKFRRGKVINLRSDSMEARRLWFNIGRLARDNPNGGGTLWMKSFSRKRSASIETIDPDSEAQSIVLKHQGVAEKKDSKTLFNHVIEETASKLVETRKSKVRALVGVFETLISLQQRKPAPKSKRGVLVTPLLKFA